LVSFLKVKMDESPYWRDVRFGDRVKQGEVLGVIWSKELGMSKAELVDATINKKLSEDTLTRHQKAFEEAAISLATLRQTEKQVQSDRAACLRALRPLKMWKIPDDEIRAIEQEAETIG